MKRIIYLLSAIVLMIGCKSVDKMVEQGKYDEAIVYAAKKLHGEKNKKTKYVKALEKAYQKVSQEDMNEIKYLFESGFANKYDRIYDLFLKIQNRQSLITPFLPLISENGYVAQFKFVRTKDKLNEFALLAAEDHYQNAKSLLQTYDTYGEKKTARSAYKTLELIDRYVYGYKDVNDLKREALDKGIERVAVSVSSNEYVYAGNISKYVLSNFDVERLNTFWTKYDAASNFTAKADYYVIIRVENINLGVQRERVDHFHEKREIIVGQKEVKNRHGKLKRDSLGNTITEPIYKEVQATVTEVNREKVAFMDVAIIIKDEKSGNVRKNIPVKVEEVFTDYMCTYSGDKRALNEDYIKRLDPNLAPFPHDIDMIENMSYQLRDLAYAKIESEISSILCPFCIESRLNI